MVYQGNRHTPEQLRTLIMEVAKNPSLCNESMFFDRQWLELADTLNGLTGPSKSVGEWMSILRDWKDLTEKIKDQLHNVIFDTAVLDDLLSEPVDGESLAELEALIRRDRAMTQSGQPANLSYLEELLIRPAQETPLIRNIKKVTKKLEKERRRNIKKKKMNALKPTFVRTSPSETIVRTNDSISMTYSPSELENCQSNNENEEPVLMLYPSTSSDSVVTPQGVIPNSKRIIIAREPDSNAINGKKLKIFFDDLDGTREDLSEYEDMKIEKLKEVTRDLEQHISSIQDRIHFIKDLWMHRCGRN